MVWSGWGNVYSRNERSTLDRFKNRNRLLKAYGQEGLSVYEALDGSRPAQEVADGLGLDPDRFSTILEFLEKNSMISSSSASAISPSAAQEEAKEAESQIPAPESEPESESKNSASDLESESRRTSAPAGRAPPSAGRMPPYPWSSEGEPASPTPPASSTRITPPGERARPAERNSPPAEPAESSGGPSHGSDEVPSAAASLSPLERIIFDKYGQVGVKVYNLIDGERTAEDILHETGLSETKLVEVLEFMNEQGIIKLERPARPPPAGTPPSASASPPGGFSPTGAAPYPGASGYPPSGSPYPPGAGYPPSGSPSYPGAPGGAVLYPPAQRPPAARSDDNVGFKPMVEGEEEDGASLEHALSPDAVPVDVPVLPSQISILQRAQMAGMLSMKFGKVGHDLLSHIDGKKDFVDLAYETGLNFADLDIILGELGKANLLSFKQLNRTEIRHRYGDDGLAVYKRFGRDGLLVYQMIGKANSLREIALKSRVETERLVDILIFVHRVLGLDLPMDRDTIYRYLRGNKK